MITPTPASITDAVGWVASVMTMQLGMLGTISITLGVLLVFGLIFAFGIGIYRSLKGRR